ncbi:hypothetical protein BHM03_00061326, partial [Ensete ventricosum]
LVLLEDAGRRDVVPVPQDLARARTGEPGEQTEEGRLPEAIGAGQNEGGAIDVSEDRPSVTRAGDVVKEDPRRGRSEQGHLLQPEERLL